MFQVANRTPQGEGTLGEEAGRGRGEQGAVLELKGNRERVLISASFKATVLPNIPPPQKKKGVSGVV